MDTQGLKNSHVGIFVAILSLLLSAATYLLFNVAVSEPVETQINLTWDRPTTRLDGRPLAPSEINRTQIRYNIDGGTMQWGGSTTDGAAEELSIVVNGEPGQYLFFASVVTEDGLISGESEPASVDVPSPDLWPANTATNLEAFLN